MAGKLSNFGGKKATPFGKGGKRNPNAKNKKALALALTRKARAGK